MIQEISIELLGSTVLRPYTRILRLLCEDYFHDSL